MKKYILRITSLMLSVAVLGALFSGCQGKAQPNSTQISSETQTQQTTSGLGDETETEGTTEEIVTVSSQNDQKSKKEKSEKSKKTDSKQPSKTQNGKKVNPTKESISKTKNQSKKNTTKNRDKTTTTTKKRGEPGTEKTKPNPPTIKVPESKKQAIELYNKTLKDAYSKKVGFEKKRYTSDENYKIPGLVAAFKGIILKFAGIGDKYQYATTVIKGDWNGEFIKHYLRQSTLSENDVTGYSAKKSGNTITITLNIKDGNSYGSASKTTTNAPIDKCGICVGDNDKDYYDHKIAQNYYAAIDSYSPKATVEESYKDAVSTLKINANTGEITSMKVDFHVDVKLNNVLGADATASGCYHTEWKNFKY